VNKFTFRRIEPQEIDSWFSLRIESLKDSPSAFLASPELELAQGVEFFRQRLIQYSEHSAMFGCFDESNEIVGSVGISRMPNPKTIHKATIWGVYVKPEYRGNQIAHKLMQLAIDFGKHNMKVIQIELGVESTRTSAKQLYSSFGFVKWGTEKNAIMVDGKFFDEDHMSLNLQS
jgi:RimJ/RimL family protein N-acetyltransferase